MPTEMHRVGDIRPVRVSPDRDIADLAARQYGVVEHGQLVDLGLTPTAIQHRLRAGRLHLLHRRVYAVGHTELSRHGRWTAAVLACGPHGVLSHRGASALCGVLPYSGTRIDVTVVGGRPRNGIAVHRVRQLHGDDRDLVEGIPVTTVARTLVDLAPVLRLDQLRRAIEEAERRDLFDLRAVERVMTPGRRGVNILRAALRDYYDPGFTRSEFERRFARLCRDAGIRPPAMNIWIGDQEVDAVWEDEKVVVQLDGYEFHRTRAAFERDRRRDAQLQVAGYRVLRVTYRWLQDDPAAVVTALRSLLSSRRK